MFPPMVPYVVDFVQLSFTFQIRLILLICRSRGPVECESLQNDVSINCLKTEEKLLSTWYPRVINLFTKSEALEGIKSDKIDSFHNCVATLMSNQVKLNFSFFSGRFLFCLDSHMCISTVLEFLCACASQSLHSEVLSLL